MTETIVDREIERVYDRLKTHLSRAKCKIICEDAPNSVSVVQGSLWGITPKTAQKTVTFKLRNDAIGIQIPASSALTKGYWALTGAGIVFSTLVLLVCIWMATNLQAYISTGFAGFWGGLGQTNGAFDAFKANMLVRLCWTFTAFLIISLVIEAFIIVYVKTELSVFAKEAVASTLK